MARNPRCNSDYYQFGYSMLSGSHDGQCVFFKHWNQVSTSGGEQAGSTIKWLTQHNELEGGGKVDQPAIVLIDGLGSLGEISELAYSSENELHAHHHKGSVSLLDPSTKTLISIEDPQDKQRILDWVISPNADYIAVTQRVEEEERGDGKRFYKATVKQKFRRADWIDIFEYKAGKVASSRMQARSPSDEPR